MDLTTYRHVLQSTGSLDEYGTVIVEYYEAMLFKGSPRSKWS